LRLGKDSLLAEHWGGTIYDCAAPDIDQTQVIDHLSSSVSEHETRNVLRESARPMPDSAKW